MVFDRIRNKHCQIIVLRVCELHKILPNENISQKMLEPILEVLFFAQEQSIGIF